MMKIDNRIIWLRSQGFDDQLVLAVLSTEMHFRPLEIRVLEYLSYCIFGSTRTIGIGQIHIKHWNRLGYFGWRVLPAALKPELNYKVCAELLYDDESLQTIHCKLSGYTGEVTQSYFRVFSIYHDLLCSKKPSRYSEMSS